MIRSIIFLAFLVLFITGGNIVAQDDKTDFDFLKTIYDKHDPKLADYLSLELKTFLSRYEESRYLPDALYLLARVHMDNGDKYRAVILLLKIFFLYPDHDLVGPVTTDIHAIIAKGTGFKDDKEKISKIIDSPQDSESMADRSYRFLEFLYELRESNFYEWTLPHYYEFIINYKSYTHIDRVYRWIAGTYTARGDHEAAVAAYLKFEHMFPENVHVSRIKNQRAGIIYKELKNYDDAINVFSGVIADYPNTVESGNALFSRAEIKAEKLKDYDGAITDYRELMNSMPQHEQAVDALFKIADIKSRKMKSFIAAIEIYDEIVANYPTDKQCAIALEKAADLHAKIKEYDLAAEKYARISSMFPDNENAARMLAKAASICEGNTKNYGKAIEYYRLLKSEYPDSEYSKKADKKIEDLNKKM